MYECLCGDYYKTVHYTYVSELIQLVNNSTALDSIVEWENLGNFVSTEIVSYVSSMEL